MWLRCLRGRVVGAARSTRGRKAWGRRCRRHAWREFEHHGSRDLVMPGLGVLVEDCPEVPETEEEAADEPPDDLTHEHLPETRDCACLVVDHLKTQQLLAAQLATGVRRDRI